MKNTHTKYLVLVHRNESLPPNPAEFKDIGHVTQWLEQQQKEGKLESWGLFGLNRGGFGVWNVESMDELHVINATAPYAPYATYEVYPLVNVPAFNKALKEVEAHIAKMMPVGAGR